ncbi:hypothetical protein JCM19236_5864 [Vibrio sp. JCM 19236]|nr:hypothetical protein JCM19236_5864 [Vibrio sp. JCM 19236]
MKLSRVLIASAMLVGSSSTFAADLPWTPDPIMPSWSDAPEAGDTDAATAGVKWISELPTIMAGKWITFTGENGAPLKSGKFSIESDGSFKTEQGVALEVHYYDSDTAEVGELIKVVGDSSATVGVSEVQYTIGDVSFESEKGADVSKVKAIIKQGPNPSTAQIVSPNIANDYSALGLDKESAGQTFWNITSGTSDVFTERVPGDKITASALVTVDVEFAKGKGKPSR